MKTFVIGLFCVVAATAAEATPSLTREQAKALVRSANTPQQHLQLAEYYRGEAQRLAEQSREYSAKADVYGNPGGSAVPFRPVAKSETYGMRCRSLSAQYLKDANKAAALADVQARMAK